MKKNNKGITLIALVITIIILLILAGVTISAVVKKNGALNNATKSATQTAIADAKDEIERAVNDATTESLVNLNGRDLALLIDSRLKQLARNGSGYKDIRYEYNYGTELDHVSKKSLRAAEVVYAKEEARLDRIEERYELTAAKKEEAPLALDAVAEQQSSEGKKMVEAAEIPVEIRNFNVYYKDELILIGKLNMDTGDFNFVDPKGVLVEKEKPVKEEVKEFKAMEALPRYEYVK